MNTNAISKYAGIKPMGLPGIVVLLGLIFGLLGYIWAWPFAIGSAVALVILILARHADPGSRKLLFGLAWTFFVSAVTLGILGIVAVSAV
ncbi:MAG: hypothetical protein HYT94_02550 [Parcubacteria group bacterium]|nr:hypothetical protein [Parcubacteria group bacterium]